MTIYLLFANLEFAEVEDMDKRWRGVSWGHTTLASRHFGPCGLGYLSPGSHDVRIQTCRLTCAMPESRSTSPNIIWPQWPLPSIVLTVKRPNFESPTVKFLDLRSLRSHELDIARFAWGHETPTSRLGYSIWWPLPGLATSTIGLA